MPEWAQNLLAEIVKTQQQQAAAQPDGEPVQPRVHDKVPCPTLSETSPEAWHGFRARFERAKVLNHWTNCRARRHLQNALTGEAEEIVRLIPIGDAVAEGDEDAADVSELLDEYQAQFIDPTKIAMLLAKVERMRMKPGEELNAWHGRLKTAFRFANPDLTEDLIQSNSKIVDIFLGGLTDPAVTEKALDRSPATYTEALNAASAAYASEARKSRVRQNYGPTSSNRLGMSEVAPMPTSTGSRGGRGRRVPGAGPAGARAGLRCYLCDSQDHTFRACPFSAVLKKNNFTLTRGGSKGGRGGKNNRGRRTNPNIKKPGLSTMTPAEPTPAGEELVTMYAMEEDQGNGDSRA